MDSKHILDKLMTIRQELIATKVKTEKVDKQLFELYSLIVAERMAGTKEILYAEELDIGIDNADCGCCPFYKSCERYAAIAGEPSR